MDSATRKSLIERYNQGYDEVLRALTGISDDELGARPMADAWTPREIVHHLADSEMTSAIRLRRLLAEDNPTIDGYDEALFARVLNYDTRPIQPSLDAFRAARTSTTSILERLRDNEWSRAGTHSESGR